MRLKNTLSSIRYYKKNNLIIFFFFSLSLIIISSIQSIRLVQLEKMHQIKTRWHILQTSLPVHEKSIFALTLADFNLQNKYLQILYFSAIFILLGIVFITFVVLIKRKKDIKAMLTFGLKKRQILFQIIIENLITVFLSFIIVIGLVFLFQTPLKNAVIQSNESLYLKELPAEMVLTNVNPQNEPDRANVLLPFNGSSLYYQDTQEKLSFSTLYFIYSFNFFLLAISLLLVTSLATLLYASHIEKHLYT